MNPFEKNRLPHVVFGAGSAKQTGEKVKYLGATKCLIVTDEGVIKAGLVDDVLKSLEASQVEYEIYDKVLPNPPDYVCMEVADVLRDSGCDCTIALGGGSSIDTAKAANLIAALPEKIDSLHDYGATGSKMKTSFKRNVKFIAIPTTSGTGAEVTASAVITDPKLNLKYSFMNESMVTDLVIIDPDLTIGMPPKPTASVGLDALSHAMEVVIGVKQNAFSTPLAFDYIERIRKWLPIVYKNPGNKEGRAQLSYTAHMAESTGGAANGHCVAHAIGARYHVVHGHSAIMVIPALIRHHAEASAENIAKLADIFAVPKTGTAKEVADYVADAVLDFYKSFGFENCKKTLEANGFDDDVDQFTENLIPAILDDFKSRNWVPPIDGEEDRENLVNVCHMIYNEK